MTSVGIFQRVRKTLDENGYKESLPLEALPLVNHLIQDLLETRHELNAKKSSLEKLKENCESLKLSLGPFKEENGRLLTEVNKLHMENLKLRESVDKSHKDHENALQKLVSENQNFIFLVEELKRHICSLEKESQSKNEKILLLQQQNLKAVVVTPGGTTTHIASQRQRLETTALLPPSNMTSHEKCSKCGCSAQGQKARTKDLYLADLLRMTDKKLLILQGEVESHKRRSLHSQHECSQLEKKVANRDEEILRLQGLLEGGRAVHAVLEDNKLLAAHAQLHQLKLQVDHLTKTNSELELKLKSTLGETHEAMSRAMQMADVNKGLASELHGVAHANFLLKEDCNSTAESLNAKLARNQEKLEYFKGDLEQQHSLYHATRDERDRLKVELSRLNEGQARLSDELSQLRESNKLLKKEKDGLEEVLARGLGERKNLADRINTLTVQLQERNMECRRLHSEASTLRSSIAALEAKAQRAEADRKAVVRQKTDVELEKAFVRSELIKEKEKKEQACEERTHFKDRTEELQEQKVGLEQAHDFLCQDLDAIKLQLTEAKKMEQKLKDKIQETIHALEGVEAEKDHYSEQVVQLLDLLKVKPMTMASVQIARSKLKPEEELGKALYEREVVLQERDFLKAQLQRIKRGKEVIAVTPSSSGVMSDQPPDKAMEVPTDSDPQFPWSSQIAPAAVPDSEAMESLRSERDQLRSQVDNLQRMLDETKMKLLSRTSPPPIPAPIPSPAALTPSPRLEGAATPKKDDAEFEALRYELKSVEREKTFFQEQYERMKASLATTEDASLDSADLKNLLRENKAIKEEREFYLKQYKDLSTKFTESLAAPSNKGDALKGRLHSVLAEKRALALAKAQLETQVLTLKDDLMDAEREKAEVSSVKKELAKSLERLHDTTAQKFPVSMQKFISEIRKSRDAALGDAEKLRHERDDFKQKVKVLSAQLARDKSVAQEDLSTLQVQKGQSEALASDLQQRLQSQAELIVSLQEQIRTLQEALQQAQSELGMSSKQSEQLRKLLQSKVGEADSQGQQLVATASKLTVCQAKVVAVEGDVKRLEEDVSRLEAENQILRRNLSKMDSEKDNLTVELDNKSEYLATIKNEMKKRSAQIAALEAEAAKREASIESCEGMIDLEKRRVAEEKTRCEGLQQDLAVTKEQREAANREIRRLQKEVAGLTQDIRELKAELERTKTCRENFKKKAQEYCRTLERMSLSITVKDKEQDTLMQQYLSLNETLSSLNTLNATLEQSAVTQHQELTRMEEMLNNFKDEREQLIAQVNESLTKIEDLEASYHRLKEEKFAQEKDLLTAKDLTQKVEMKRDEADCEARRLSATIEKVLEEKRARDQHVESLSAQLQSERSTLHSLEEMLAEKRKAEFEAATSLQHLQVEKVQLQRKVAELNSDLESEVAEVKRIRSRLATLELEAERLRRQLTTEQYERERADQELRRARTSLLTF